MAPKKALPRPVLTGWTQVPYCRGSNGHVTDRPGYRCPHYQQCVDNSYRRCDISMRRKDHTNDHVHFFRIPSQQDKEFNPDFLMDGVNVKDISRQITTAASIYMGKSNTSASEISRECFRNYTKLVFNLGVKAGRVSPNITAESAIRFYTAKTYTAAMLESSAKLLATLKQRYVSCKYVCLVGDAGTVLCLHSFMAILQNPFSLSVPMLYRMFDLKDGIDAQQYATIFGVLIADACQDRIAIAGVTLDGLASQNKGLRDLKDSTNDKYIKAILHINCFCHAINLVFVHSMKDSAYLQDVVQEIRSMRQLLRKRDAILQFGRSAPGFPETRWLYIVDLLQYFDRYSDVINAYLATDGSTLPESFDSVGKILSPLKQLTLILESQHISLAEVVPRVQNAMEEYKKLQAEYESNSELTELIKIIVANLLSRIKSNSYTETITAFCLSIPGRYYINSIIRNDFSQNMTRVQGDKHISIRNNRMHVGPETDNTNMEFSVHSTGPARAATDDEQFSEALEEEEVDEIIETKFNDNYQRYIEMSTKELVNIPPYDDFLPVAIKEINRMGLVLEYEDDFSTLYQSWLEDDEMCSLTPGTPNSIEEQEAYKFSNLHWIQMLTSSRLAHLADIALRYLSILPSEAEAERFISVQRDVQGDKGTNFSCETIYARVLLRTNCCSKTGDNENQNDQVNLN